MHIYIYIYLLVGFRKKKWNVGSLDYGERWHTGDVIGVLLDTDRLEMQYFLNGRSLGIAFEGRRTNIYIGR
jgi:hypothetical protein